MAKSPRVIYKDEFFRVVDISGGNYLIEEPAYDALGVKHWRVVRSYYDLDDSPVEVPGSLLRALFSAYKPEAE